MEAEGPTELWLGDSEGLPPHWGGGPRRAVVLGMPALATGAAVYLVRIEPPIVRPDGRPLGEAIVMPRYRGTTLAASESDAIVVNILGPAPGVDIRAPRFTDGQLVIEFWADAATTIEALPEPVDEAAFWAETLARIRHFIDIHGHSRVPDGYHDDHGRLDIIVGNLRWHRAGKGGVSPGPFPGVDYASDLDRMPGWEW